MPRLREGDIFKVSDDISKQIEEFLARGGKPVEGPAGASGKVEHTTFGNNSKPTYKLPSSGYRHILERHNKHGNITYAVKIYATHYGTLPSLDLAIHRRNKIWKKLGITEADFV